MEKSKIFFFFILLFFLIFRMFIELTKFKIFIKLNLNKNVQSLQYGRDSVGYSDADAYMVWVVLWQQISCFLLVQRKRNNKITNQRITSFILWDFEHDYLQWIMLFSYCKPY